MVRKVARGLEPFRQSYLPYIYLLGGPGSGKASQAAKLKSSFGFTSVNVGLLLRDEAQMLTSRADRIRAAIAKGEIAPYDITVQLLKDALIKGVRFGKPFIIHGFPRCLTDKQAFEAEVGRPPLLSIILQIPETTMKKRMHQRGRCDDQNEIINRKMSVYERQTRPMLEEMIACGDAFKVSAFLQISAEGTPERVAGHILRALESRCDPPEDD